LRFCANWLALVEKTIKHYMTNIQAKLHARGEAALFAQKTGLGDERSRG